MERTGKKVLKYGLVGRNISYSFSRAYFASKFRELNLEHCRYDNYDLESIDLFPQILADNPELKGLNVTIPYKEAVLPFLDAIDPEAAQIGAVNTITFGANGLTGFNTDVFGFRSSLVPLLKDQHKRALVLGTGGASKAVTHVLKELGIHYSSVSRKPEAGQLAYSEIGPEQMASHLLVINTTPLGTYPDLKAKPPLPYEAITSSHLLYDLIYNPERTAFLKEGEERGATVMNGLRMLELQAEKAWELWTN